MVAAGGGHHAGLRHVARQQIGERPARLERARVLQQLELEVDAVRIDHRRAPYVRADALVGFADSGAIDCHRDSI
jgi:hypothetical protein